MRTFLTVFLTIILSLSGQSCRKPNYSYRDPCSDSTFLALQAHESSLSAADRERLNGLAAACEEYTVEERNRGKLWPYILGGVVLAAGVLYVVLLLFSKPDVIID